MTVINKLSFNLYHGFNMIGWQKQPNCWNRNRCDIYFSKKSKNIHINNEQKASFYLFLLKSFLGYVVYFLTMKIHFVQYHCTQIIPVMSNTLLMPLLTHIISFLLVCWGLVGSKVMIIFLLCNFLEALCFSQMNTSAWYTDKENSKNFFKVIQGH